MCADYIHWLIEAVQGPYLLFVERWIRAEVLNRRYSLHALTDGNKGLERKLQACPLGELEQDDRKT